MFKLITAPLFLILIALWAVGVVVRPRREGKTGLSSGIWLLLMSLLLALTLISTPRVGALLALTLEAPYMDPSDELLQTLDVVTVLSSGLNRHAGSGRSELDEHSYVRTVVGVRAFQVSSARLFVLQGRLPDDESGEMAALMRELALALGVPEEVIIIESNSRNTREHPRELLGLAGISPNDVIGVVTSAWHLHRATAEFRREFARVVPVPADYLSRQLTGGIQDWIPQVSGLETTTKVIHEWVGRVWYTLVSLFR